MEKKDVRKKYKGVVNSTLSEKKKATKSFCITLTDKKIHVKLNELI